MAIKLGKKKKRNAELKELKKADIDKGVNSVNTVIEMRQVIKHLIKRIAILEERIEELENQDANL